MNRDIGQQTQQIEDELQIAIILSTSVDTVAAFGKYCDLK